MASTSSGKSGPPSRIGERKTGEKKKRATAIVIVIDDETSRPSRRSIHVMERGSGSVDAGNTSLMLFLLHACVFTVSCGITSQKARPNGRRRGREIKLESNNLFRSMNRTREGFIFFFTPSDRFAVSVARLSISSRESVFN